MEICNRCRRPHSPTSRLAHVRIGVVKSHCGPCGEGQEKNCVTGHLCEPCAKAIYEAIEADCEKFQRPTNAASIEFPLIPVREVREIVTYAPSPRIWPIWVFLVLSTAANVGFWLWR